MNFDAIPAEALTAEAVPVPVWRVCYHNRVWAAIKTALGALLVLPLIYRKIHELCGRKLFTMEIGHDELLHLRQRIMPPREFQLKRASIEVDGSLIDMAICRRNPLTDRWIVVFDGNDRSWESSAQQDALNTDYYALAARLNANILFFNPPGMGASTGSVNKSNLIAVGRGILEFVGRELGANEVIPIGYSMGGGLLAESLPKASLHAKTTAVFQRTYSCLSEAAKTVVLRRDPTHGIRAKLLAFAIRFFGWQMSPYNYAKKHADHTLVLQTSGQENPHSRAEVRDDTVISQESALATSLLDRASPVPIRGLGGDHFSPLPIATAAFIRQVM